MFCSKCGADIGDNQFCQVCGNKAAKKIDIENIADKMKKIFLKMMDNKKYIFVAGVTAVVFIIIVLLLCNHKTTVKPEDYVSVSFTGYNTVGHAEVIFDYSLFNKDYGKKIKLNKKAIKEYLKNNGMEASNKAVENFIKEKDASNELLNYCINMV